MAVNVNIPEKVMTPLEIFIANEDKWLNDLVVRYPSQIPVKELADHWGCNPESVREMLMHAPVFGLHWKKVGAKNNSFLIPTYKFVGWYCNINIYGISE